MGSNKYIIITKINKVLACFQTRPEIIFKKYLRIQIKYVYNVYINYAYNNAANWEQLCAKYDIY